MMRPSLHNFVLADCLTDPCHVVALRAQLCFSRLSHTSLSCSGPPCTTMDQRIVSHIFVMKRLILYYFVSADCPTVPCHDAAPLTQLCISGLSHRSLSCCGSSRTALYQRIVPQIFVILRPFQHNYDLARIFNGELLNAPMQFLVVSAAHPPWGSRRKVATGG